MEKVKLSELAKKMQISAEKLLEICQDAHMRIKNSEQEISAFQQKTIISLAENFKTMNKENIRDDKNTLTKEKEHDSNEQKKSTSLKLKAKEPVQLDSASKLSLKKAEPTEVTLQRKTVSQLQLSGSGQLRNKKTVTVEVRKKYTYVKKSALLDQARSEQEAKQKEEEKLTPINKTAGQITEKMGENVSYETRIPVLETAEKEDFVEKTPELVLHAKEELSAAQGEINAGEPRKQEESFGENERTLEEKRKQVLENIANAKNRKQEKKEGQGQQQPSEEKKPIALKPVIAGEVEDKEAESLQAKNKRKSKVGDFVDKYAKKRININKINLDDEEADTKERIHYKKFGSRNLFKKSLATVGKQEFEKPTVPVVREVSIPDNITVAELADRMSVKAAVVIKKLLQMGEIATINQILDRSTALLLVEEFGHKAKLYNENALEDELAVTDKEKAEEQIVNRAPIVTIMGHVDHGKTSLLDYIRRSKVAAGEAGGITQNIGAYHVETKKGMITFLDTPGHAAFTAMRARGSKVTDIVVLVVAADDSVMPQTIEAIEHARAANVPIVVAINKIDKPDADPNQVVQALLQHGVISEEFGGDTMMAKISAKTGEGVDTLLDTILLQAEMLELKAPINVPARGIILESRLDKGRGVVASILLQRGTLRKGDIVLSGLVYGRVRAVLDETGRQVDSAGPAIPVEVLGLSGIPVAGDEAVVVSDERKAREIALFRQSKYRDTELASKKSVKLEDLFSSIEQEKISTLNIILKASVQGSVEAIRDALLKLSTDEVQVKIISSGVGGITESDVNLALASNAVIIGFNVRADVTAKKIIEKENVDIHYHSIIYEVISQIKNSLSGMLSPEIKEKIIGLAEVREVFRSPKFGAIAGCMVIDGVVKRSKPIRVLRNNVVIFEGELESLRRFKEDAREVRQGMECGIGVKNYDDVVVGDQIEVFDRIETERTLA